MECPDIYQYDDYRKFLKDLYLQRRQKFTRYSYIRLATELGLTRNNFLNIVVSGKRNLSLKTVEKIADQFQWSRQQKRYFRELVLLNQASTQSEKEKHRAELDKILGKQRKRIHPDEYRFFDNWYIPVIRELISFKTFVASYNWIARMLRPKISENLAKQGMDVLERLGMIKKEKGRWVQVDKHLATDPQTFSDLLRHYHIEMLKLARHALDIPAEERDMACMTMGLTQKQFEELKQRLIEFRDEVQQDLQDQSDNPEMVAQLNMYLFPSTHRALKKKH